MKAWIAAIPFAMFAGSAFAACPTPNPNISAGTPGMFFLDGCPLPASGLNNLLGTATSRLAGPNSSTANDLPVFSDTTGKTLKDSGLALTRLGCQSITLYGGAGDNATDNAPALTAAIAAQSAQPCVFFPPGKFKFASTVAITLGAPYGAITLAGSGPGVTELIGAAGLGIIALTETAQFNTFNFQDFSVEASSPCSGCKGISVVQSATAAAEGYTPTSSFSRVHLYGTDRNINQGSSTDGVNYWGTAIYIQGTSNVNFEGVYIQGLANNTLTAAQYGIDVETSGSNIPVVFNMHSTAINSVKTALNLTTLVQGVTVSQSNFTNDQVGINVPSGSGPGSQLTVSNSQFACNIGVDINTIWGGVQLSSNLFLIGQVGSANWYGVQLGPNVSLVTATGNVFAGTGGPGTVNAIGMSVAPINNKSGAIVGNEFTSLDFGIVLDPGTSGWVINPNHYVQNTFNLIDNTSGFGNVINTSVGGGEPTVGSGASDCGTGAAFQGGSTDQSGLLEVGTSPGSKCTVTFSHAFVQVPVCIAENSTSLSRGAAALFVTTTNMQITSSGSLNATDELMYRCDGYQ